MSAVDFAHLATCPPQVAIIDESACIGCTKCIAACPFDAILGASRQMHAVLTELCTGCELCVAPCPVDCITMHRQDPSLRPRDWLQQALERYRSRTQRLRHNDEAQASTAQVRNLTRAAMRAEITAAVERNRAKRAASIRRVPRSPKDYRP